MLRGEAERRLNAFGLPKGRATVPTWEKVFGGWGRRAKHGRGAATGCRGRSGAGARAEGAGTPRPREGGDSSGRGLRGGRAQLPGVAGSAGAAVPLVSAAVPPSHASCHRGHPRLRRGERGRPHGTAPTHNTPPTPAVGPPQPPARFSPRAGPALRHPEAGRGRAPARASGPRSPLPPLTLFGWTEGCLRESFSTLFHIHNGLNIGEQSGTWRAKPSPWSEPMSSPPR